MVEYMTLAVVVAVCLYSLQNSLRTTVETSMMLQYPDCSLADLYDEAVIPPELRKAHQLNDRAVMEAYGFWGKLNSESECVAVLMGMYREMMEK